MLVGYFVYVQVHYAFIIRGIICPVGGMLPFLLLLFIFASYDHGCGVRNTSSMADLSNGVLFVGILRGNR